MNLFRSRGPVLLALAGVTAVLLVGACGESDDGGGDAGGGKTSLELSIGSLVPLTGDLSAFGAPGRKSADLAVKEIEKAAKAVGADHTVTVTHEDTQTDPQAAVQAARKLTGADNATCLAGPWTSSETIPVARSVVVREEVLQISPSATSDEITTLDDDGMVNRTIPPDSFQAPALADPMTDEDFGGEANGKVVNLGARNDAYGTVLADAFVKVWEDRGGEIGENVIYDPEQASYNSEAAQLTAGNPDAWVVLDFPETYGKLGPALVRTGKWDPAKTWVGGGLQTDSLPKDVGREATEGVRGSSPGTPDDAEAFTAFADLYDGAGGPSRQPYDAHEFDAVLLCYLTAVAAGSTDGPDMAAKLRDVSGPPGKTYTWQELDEAVRALQDGKDINYEGASGPVDLNENGDPTSGVYDLFRYENEKLEIYGELPISEEDAK